MRVSARNVVINTICKKRYNWYLPRGIPSLISVLPTTKGGCLLWSWIHFYRCCYRFQRPGHLVYCFIAVWITMSRSICSSGVQRRAAERRTCMHHLRLMIFPREPKVSDILIDLHLPLSPIHIHFPPNLTPIPRPGHFSYSPPKSQFLSVINAAQLCSQIKCSLSVVN